MADPYKILQQGFENTAKTLDFAQRSLIQSRELQMQQQQQLFNQDINLRKLDLAERDQAFDHQIQARRLALEEQMQPLKMGLQQARLDLQDRNYQQRIIKDQLKAIKEEAVDPNYGMDLTETLRGEAEKQSIETQLNTMVSGQGMNLPAEEITDDPVLDAATSLFDDRDPVIDRAPEPVQAPAGNQQLALMNSAVRRAEQGIKGGTAAERLAQLQPLYQQQEELIASLTKQGDSEAESIYKERLNQARTASSVLTDPNTQEGERNAAREQLLRLGRTPDQINNDIVSAAGKRSSLQEYNRLNDIQKDDYNYYQDILRANKNPDMTMEQVEALPQVQEAKQKWLSTQSAVRQYGLQAGLIPPTVVQPAQDEVSTFLKEIRSRYNR